jgi:hypothetical protein
LSLKSFLRFSITLAGAVIVYDLTEEIGEHPGLDNLPTHVGPLFTLTRVFRLVCYALALGPFIHLNSRLGSVLDIVLITHSLATRPVVTSSGIHI